MRLFFAKKCDFCICEQIVGTITGKFVKYGLTFRLPCRSDSFDGIFIQKKKEKNANTRTLTVIIITKHLGLLFQ